RKDPGDLAVVQGDDMGVLADAPDQSGQHLTGPDLEKFRAAPSDHLDDGGRPLDRLEDMVGQLLADVIRTGQDRAGDIGDDGNTRLTERKPSDDFAELRGGPRHQRGMRGDADRQPYNPGGAASAGELGGRITRPPLA